MSNMLFEILSKREKELAEEVFNRLRSSQGGGYQKMDETVLRGRAEHLVESFLGSISHRPAVFVDYICAIAEERISEGIVLREIQVALQILEEKTWQLVVENIDQSGQVSCLSQATSIIGTAKDQLAQIYLQRMEKAESRVTRLRARVDQLAKGTDSGPVEEDDLF